MAMVAPNKNVADGWDDLNSKEWLRTCESRILARTGEKGIEHDMRFWYRVCRDNFFIYNSVLTHIEMVYSINKSKSTKNFGIH